jgi:hypothetical protein
MKIKTSLLALVSILGLSTSAQEVRLTFDTDQSDFGAFEISGTDTALTLSRNEGTIATNDFAELDELSSETYSMSGVLLGVFSPVGFTVTTSGGVANLDTGGFDVAGSGIGPGESITFIFDTNIEISEFDLANIDASEFAAITIAGSAQLFADSTNDVHTGSFSLTAGQSLVFGFADVNGAGYDIQAFTFNAVPEAGTCAILAGVSTLCFVILRRRNQK